MLQPRYLLGDCETNELVQGQTFFLSYVNCLSPGRERQAKREAYGAAIFLRQFGTSQLSSLQSYTALILPAMKDRTR